MRTSISLMSLAYIFGKSTCVKPVPAKDVTFLPTCVTRDAVVNLTSSSAQEPGDVFSLLFASQKLRAQHVDHPATRSKEVIAVLAVPDCLHTTTNPANLHTLFLVLLRQLATHESTLQLVRPGRTAQLLGGIAAAPRQCPASTSRQARQRVLQFWQHLPRVC